MKEINIPSIAEQEENVTFMCICPECASWIECGEKGGFCFETIGKSSCISEEKECICAACSVPLSLGFKHEHYCTRGSAKEQDNNSKP